MLQHVTRRPYPAKGERLGAIGGGLIFDMHAYQLSLVLFCLGLRP